jgi:hypothetical protein
MRKEIFEVHLKTMRKLEQKIELMQTELESIQSIVNPFLQFHEPNINITTLKEKYWNCNCLIELDGKMTRHSVYLGIKENFEGKTDKKLIKLAKQKIEVQLRKKYPKMFE